MSAEVVYADFWCDYCKRWTTPDDQEEPGTAASCSTCGEYYQCQECGFEIDGKGHCLRNQAGSAEDVGRCPSNATLERRFVLLKDGVQQGKPHTTELDALGALHKQVGYSAAHACEHEGWEIRAVEVMV